MKKIKSLLTIPVVRYILIGGLAYISEISVIYILTGSGLTPITSVAIAFWIGLIVSFLLQKLIAFKNYSFASKTIATQIPVYICLVLFNYLFTLIFVWALSNFIPLIAARTIALLITTAWNFYFYNNYLFNSNLKLPYKKNNVSRQLLTLPLFILPIVIFLSPLFTYPTSLLSGDYDMQVQMTEAARLSIQDFHQFPLWNPWVSGGVPLFADPQFGLFTPQTLLAFAFGAIFAWKLTILLYFIVGFFSMQKLLLFLNKKSKSSIIVCSLLAYIWIFGGFFTFRATGHLVFLLLALTPLAIYFCLRLKDGKRYFLLLTLLFAYCINAALHYSTILIFLTCLFITAAISGFTLLNILIKKRAEPLNKMMLLNIFAPVLGVVSAIIVAIMICLPRVILSLQYLATNSVDRSSVYEPFVGIRFAFDSLTTPLSHFTASPTALFSPAEATSNIGLLTLLLFIALSITIVYLLSTKKLKVSSRYFIVMITLLCLTLLSFLLGLGGKPYDIFRDLPVISSMRVSTRFFFITSLGVIILLGCYYRVIVSSLKKHGTKFKIATVFILSSSLIVLVYSNYMFNFAVWTVSSKNPGIQLIDIKKSDYSSPPRSEKDWKIREAYNDYALTKATISNRAQAIADNALVDTRALPSERCDEDELPRGTCSFVLTGNAKVNEWTPNEFTLTRTGDGIIYININQAAGWKVNGQYFYKNQKTVESKSTLVLPDSDEKHYRVIYQPALLLRK